jgi:chromosome segregation ATPase
MASDPARADALLAKLRLQIATLYRIRGLPSYRELAKNLGISHSTVGNVLRCERLPSWGQLQQVIDALQGDVREFHGAWLAVKEAQDPLNPPSLHAAAAPAEREVRTLPSNLSEVESARADVQDRLEDQWRNEWASREELSRTEQERNRLLEQIEEMRQQVEHSAASQAELERYIADLEIERSQLGRRITVLQTEIRRTVDERLELLEDESELNERRAQLYFDWARHEERERQATQARLREAMASNASDY